MDGGGGGGGSSELGAPRPAPSHHVCARPSLLWQLAPLRQRQAAESSPLLRGKMLSLKRRSGASAFYCNRRHRLPFVNLLVCARARGERARESGPQRWGTGGGDGRRRRPPHANQGGGLSRGAGGAVPPQRCPWPCLLRFLEGA